MCDIHHVNLAGVDLNLLVVLHAVIEERSATRAAARLHLTQPAVSNALARCRTRPGDPVVGRTGRGRPPPPAARAWRPRRERAPRPAQWTVPGLDPFGLAASTRERALSYPPLDHPPRLPRLRPLRQQPPPGA